MKIDHILDKAIEKWGKTHYVEVRRGVDIDLRTLASNESVAWGDGETCHIFLTEKPKNLIVL